MIDFPVFVKSGSEKNEENGSPQSEEQDGGLAIMQK